MSEKTAQPSSRMDSTKLFVAVLVLVAGIAGFYWFETEPLFVRIAIMIAAVAVAIGVAYTTSVGKGLWHFAVDSRVEVRKMVWPTRNEAMQTTAVVFLLVILIGLFLWLVDSLLGWVVRSITG
ncbi:MAG TPA: preprotein translocase subunit SecE [Halothiobacillus sp.]|nr:preprotein translocase subunit SecE [Halothiobacillus sp.]